MLAILLVLTTACSSASGDQGQDPANAEIELKSDPSPVAAGQPAEVTATISGISDTSGADVQFDIRELDNPRHPNYVVAGSKGDGAFSAPYTFKQAGSYTIYIHYYQQGIHITKKKQLEVT